MNFNDASVCSGNGTCSALDICNCNEGWTGNKCQTPICEGVPADLQQVCNYGNGTCTQPGACVCNDGWTGSNCSIPICFNILSNNQTVCSGNGACNLNNTCQCETGFVESDCSVHTCFGLKSTNTEVCHGEGSCTDVDICDCKNDTFSSNCSLLFISTSHVGLSFSQSSIVVNSTTPLKIQLVIDHSKLLKYYNGRDLKITLEHILNNATISKQYSTFTVSQSRTALNFTLPILTQVGTLYSHIQLTDTTSDTVISSQISSVGLQVTVQPNPRYVIDNKTVVAIVVGILVPFFVIAIIAALVALIVSYIIKRKKVVEMYKQRKHEKLDDREMVVL